MCYIVVVGQVALMLSSIFVVVLAICMHGIKIPEVRDVLLVLKTKHVSCLADKQATTDGVLLQLGVVKDFDYVCGSCGTTLSAP